MRGVARAARRSALYFVIAQGVVAGVVQWSITRYTDPAELPVRCLDWSSWRSGSRRSSLLRAVRP